MRKTSYSLLPCLPALAIVCAIVIAPITWLFVLSFVDESGITLRNYTRMIEGSGYLLSLKTTFRMSFTVTIAAAILGYPLAYLVASLRGRMATVMVAIILIPLWTALLVRTFAWMILLQKRGIVNQALLATGIIGQPLDLSNNFQGTAIGMTHVMLPFMVLPLLAAMRSVDGRLIHAAASLGASPLRAFWGVFFRLSAPGLLAGTILVFVTSLGFYVMPALLGGGRVFMWAMKIESNVNQYPNWGAASALGVILLIVTTVILLTARAMTGWLSGGRQQGTLLSAGNSGDINAAGLMRGWPALVFAVPVLAYLLLPTLIVVPISFSETGSLQFPPRSWSLHWYTNLTSSLEWRSAAIRSLVTALLAMLVATPAGLSVALWLRDRTDPISQVIRGVILLPLLVPTILIAIGIFFLYARLGLNGTLLGLVLAHIAVALPLVLITLEAGLTQSDRSLERAAQSLGASPLRALADTTIPQIKLSLITAALFAFLTSFDEIVIAYFISSGDQATLPRRMFSALRDSFDPTIAAISTLLICLSIAVIGLAMWRPKREI